MTGDLLLPPSTTIDTPGIVSDDSAMFVASTTFRRADDATARSWASGDRSP